MLICINIKNILRNLSFISFCLLFLFSLSLHANELSDFNKASELTIQRNYSKSNYYYLKILSKQSNNSEALYGLAYNFHCLSQNNRALSELKKLFKINPDHEKGLMLRALINSQNKKWHKVLVDLGHVIRINPMNEEAYSFMDGAYSSLGDKKAAKKALDRSIEIRNLKK